MYEDCWWEEKEKHIAGFGRVSHTHVQGTKACIALFLLPQYVVMHHIFVSHSYSLHRPLFTSFFSPSALPRRNCLQDFEQNGSIRGSSLPMCRPKRWCVFFLEWAPFLPPPTPSLLLLKTKKAEIGTRFISDIEGFDASFHY
jgi:hypothetical protein